MFYITCDVDWAPERVIEDFLELLTLHQVKCTFFATHNSAALKFADPALFEIALHPNYNALLNGQSAWTRKEILQELLDIYPDAKGVRSHSLVQSSNMLQDFVDLGLKYDVNQFLPYQTLSGPYKWFNGLVRVPYNWEDDVHFLNDHSFSSLLLNENDRYNILDFHPVHTYLNTDRMAVYESAKTHYQDAPELLKFRNTSTPGTRDIFIDTLRKIKESYTMMELVHTYLHESSDNW